MPEETGANGPNKKPKASRETFGSQESGTRQLLVLVIVVSANLYGRIE